MPNYWGKEEEERIKNYQQTRDEELYSRYIIPSFKELIKNIYLTYNFNKILNDYHSVENDLLAFVFEKIDKFDPSRGTKSFSYFGTSIKNWLIHESRKEKKKVHIDDDNRKNILDSLSIKNKQTEKEKRVSEDLVNEITENLLEYKGDIILDEDDEKIIPIILEIIKDYQKVDIVNKKQLYVYVRESCNLPTRKITNSLNKMKTMYENLREHQLQTHDSFSSLFL